MIGIRIAGKNDRISAAVFIRSLNNFLDLIKDVDSLVSKRPRGSVRWDLHSLQKSSPALVQFEGRSRIREMDYSTAIQESILDGIDQLSESPEQPQFYSYSALRRLRGMSAQAKYTEWVSVYTEGRQALVTPRLYANVEFLISAGSKSLGSIRGSLDSISVHSGHEFQIWTRKSKRPVTCIFEKAELPQVVSHLKQEVEVFGELQRNARGEAVLMKVVTFTPLEPVRRLPSIQEASGLIPDLYGGKSLSAYLDELRHG